jgi:hypothetical protein
VSPAPFSQTESSLYGGLRDLAPRRFGELRSILPDVYRMARQSAQVLSELKTMKFRIPELSARALNGLASTNFLALDPGGRN